VAESNGEGTPQELRDGVRAGILASLERDVAQRGGRTARRLIVAGAVGVLAAMGATLLLSGHPFEHHPSWHAVFFGAAWTGLLVVGLALVLLDVRTPRLPLGSAAQIAMLGLGLAGVCGVACPDQHFLSWWDGTTPGGWMAARGEALSALCFGLVSTLVVGFGAAAVVPLAKLAPTGPTLLSSAMLFAVLAPGVALQSAGESWAVLWSWLLGSAAGAHAGVTAALRLRNPGR
jgi:hypothetical protein